MNDEQKKLHHDINSALSSLLSALQLIEEEWNTNQEIVEKILPLTTAKLSDLQNSLKSFYNNQ